MCWAPGITLLYRQNFRRVQSPKLIVAPRLIHENVMYRPWQNADTQHIQTTGYPMPLPIVRLVLICKAMDFAYKTMEFAWQLLPRPPLRNINMTQFKTKVLEWRCFVVCKSVCWHLHTWLNNLFWIIMSLEWLVKWNVWINFNSESGSSWLIHSW